MFEAVGARYDGPELEKEILELWRRENVFGRIMAEGASRPQFVFYEGPPTANGRPGIHHVLARTFKDLYPRYKTMRGFHCPRRAGWDTHGLPVEHEIEKELGIFDKKRIEQEVGIAKFTAHVPRVGDAPRRRMGGDDRADGLLGRLQAGLLHAAQRLHRDASGSS